MVGERPLVVTLRLDAASQGRLERERRAYFPAALNRVPAHVSLFHALPGGEEAAVREQLAQAVEQVGPFSLVVEGLMLLGRGVAYRVAARELEALHAALRAAWLAWLTPQDRQGFRPHVVVQNKVEPAVARALYERLQEGFEPWEATATGIALWYYAGGPWVEAGVYGFGGGAAIRKVGIGQVGGGEA